VKYTNRIFLTVLSSIILAGYSVCSAEGVIVGDKVRGELRRGGKIEGNVVSMEDSTFEIENVTGGFLGDTGTKTLLSISESELLYLDRLQGRRSYVFPGMFVGGLLGMMVGSRSDEMLPLGTIVGGVVGVLGGGAIGAALSTENWVTVDLALRRDRRNKLDIAVSGVFRIAH
jgi:hypothetical protein